jgi:tRNA acetyltransferase TAN1
MKDKKEEQVAVQPEQTVAEKRPAEDNNETIQKANKKQKSDTIPILRGRFKQRWLTKHSHLLKRSDDASGLMVSCSVNAETRALGQVSTCLEYYINLLFPNHESTWTRFEGKLDIDQIDIEEAEEEETEDKEKKSNGKKEEEKKKEEIERKEKKFQAIDAACGGLVFYRFRINVKPTEFVIKLMGMGRAHNCWNDVEIDLAYIRSYQGIT